MTREDRCDALRAIWMEGYNRGILDATRAAQRTPREPPVVAISKDDLMRVYEPGSCGNPDCTACARKERR